MEILIIEDEMLLAKRLQKMLLSIEPGSKIAGITRVLTNQCYGFSKTLHRTSCSWILNWLMDKALIF